MTEFFTTTIGTVISLGAILTVAVTGLLYLMGLYKKGKDGEDDRLITILQKTVMELEKKVNQQSNDIEHLSTEVEKLRSDNKKYIEIFQGRDVETKEFYKRAYAAMELNVQMHDIMTTVAKSIADTNTTMNRMLDLVGKGVDVVGKVATNK